jgi:hypothetical protein
MGCLAASPYQGTSCFSVMDTMFFIGINAGLLVLLAVGLLSARDQIKAGRKETI